MVKFVPIFLLVLAQVYALLPYHKFTIKGKLICAPTEEKRLNVNALVEAWEEDTVTSNDFISATNVTDGRIFQLSFEHMEIGSITPYLIIKHDCNPKVVYGRCYAKTLFPLAEHYHEAELGETLRVQIPLLSPKLNTTIVCGSAYPFRSQPPLLEWFSHLGDGGKSSSKSPEGETDVKSTTPHRFSPLRRVDNGKNSYAVVRVR